MTSAKNTQKLEHEDSNSQRLLVLPAYHSLTTVTSLTVVLVLIRSYYWTYCDDPMRRTLVSADFRLLGGVLAPDPATEFVAAVFAEARALSALRQTAKLPVLQQVQLSRSML
jgi:hypothetical protein